MFTKVPIYMSSLRQLSAVDFREGFQSISVRRESLSNLTFPPFAYESLCTAWERLFVLNGWISADIIEGAHAGDEQNKTCMGIYAEPKYLMREDGLPVPCTARDRRI